MYSAENTDFLKKEIGDGLKDLRIREGYSRMDFSEFASISMNSYADAENGNTLIRLDNLERLLSQLSLTLGDFFIALKLWFLLKNNNP